MRSEAHQTHMLVFGCGGGRRRRWRRRLSPGALPSQGSQLTLRVVPPWLGAGCPARGQQSRAGWPQLPPSAAWTQGRELYRAWPCLPFPPKSCPRVSWRGSLQALHGLAVTGAHL